MRIGILGCGDISGVYRTAAAAMPGLEPSAVADLDPDRAAAAAEASGMRALAPEALIGDPDVDLVVNLTPPAAHAGASRAALEAGKHVWSEKPLAVRTEDGRALVALAAERGLRLGCAPDTFLGAGIQGAIRAVDGGLVGRPVTAVATMVGRGPDAWHPNPQAFYAEGAGPLFDMGPYYLTTLVALLGPIERVAADASIGDAERVVGKGPLAGTRFPVGAPSHVAALLAFRGGATATLITSFEAWRSDLPRIELHGSEGALSLPDPNTFGGPLRVSRRGGDWEDLELPAAFRTQSRGVGIADLAAAERAGRPHRASGELALHVLEAMEAILRAARERRWVELASAPERPAPLRPAAGAEPADPAFWEPAR